jgi:hypothetical protein
MMHDVVSERAVEDGSGIELLPSDGGADDGKDSRANDGANPKPGERPGTEALLEPMFCLLGVGDQLVDGLAGKDLTRQMDAPSPHHIPSRDVLGPAAREWWNWLREFKQKARDEGK